MFRAQSIRRGAALAVVLVLLTAGAAQAAATKLNWSKCYAGLGPFQCGTLQVPLDYAQPAGTTISLAVVRLPATDPAHRIGSLLLNPGGPGGSGVDYAVVAGPFLFTPEVRARFDLVGFDPRGIARSTPLRCFGSPRQWEPCVHDVRVPDDAARREASGSRPTAILVGRLRPAAAGAIIDHMATADVARDIDLLRAAVGDEQAQLRRRAPTAPTSASPTPTCSPTGQGARGRRRARPDRLVDGRAATRPPRCRSRPGCTATSARRRR